MSNPLVLTTINDWGFTFKGPINGLLKENTKYISIAINTLYNVKNNNETKSGL